MPEDKLQELYQQMEAGQEEGEEQLDEQSEQTKLIQERLDQFAAGLNYIANEMGDQVMEPLNNLIKIANESPEVFDNVAGAKAAEIKWNLNTDSIRKVDRKLTDFYSFVKGKSV